LWLSFIPPNTFLAVAQIIADAFARVPSALK